MPMRPVRVRLSAAGTSPWIPINRYATSISIALGLIFSSNKNLTAAVQYTLDPLVDQPCNITRSTTTATLKLTNHGLSTSDSVVVSGAGAPLDGTYAVAGVTDQNTITYTVANSGATVALSAMVIPLRVLTHPVLSGITSNTDSNFSYPPTACRLACTSYTAGYVDLDVISGSK